MGVVLTAANQKGGVGKTITTVCLAATLTDLGKRVLVISLDPQRNFDMVAGPGALIARGDTASLSMLHVMRGDCSLREAIVSTPIGDLVRASSQLYQWTGEQTVSAEEYLAIRNDLEALQRLLDERVVNGGHNIKVLYKHLEGIKDEYDFILIDTNPSLTLLTMNSLYAADFVLIPAFPDRTSTEAILELWDTIQGINYYHPNRNIRVIGILMTACNLRTITYARHIKKYALLTKKMGTRLFDTKIRKSARAADYIEAGVDLVHYDPKGTTTQDYRAFTTELLQALKEEYVL